MADSVLSDYLALDLYYDAFDASGIRPSGFSAHAHRQAFRQTLKADPSDQP
jgi:hypothetical protein